MWFVSSLAQAVIIASLFCRYFKSKAFLSLMITSVTLYTFGLITKSYAHTSIGIIIDFNTTTGPFLATINFAIGIYLFRLNLTPKHFKYGLLIMIIGYLIHFSEVYYLYSAHQVSPTSHDYLVGTLLVGLGVSLMALSKHKFLSYSKLSHIGKHTLGIYLTHAIFVEMFWYFDYRTYNPLWEIGYVLIVLLLSIILTQTLSQIKYLRKVVV